MAWMVLIVAGILEIVWPFYMKQSEGFTRTLPAAVAIITMVGSVVLLAYSMKTLPMGTAYIVWSGIGAVGVFLLGIAAFGEHLTTFRLSAALLIIVGTAMMHVSTTN